MTLKMNYKESQEQQTIFSWFKLKYPQYVDLFSASAAGVNSNPKTGARLKAMGLRKDWPDIFIAVPRNGYHGLFIEYKTLSGNLRAGQQDILDLLNEQLYRASCQKGIDAAIKEIEEYLE